VTTLFIAVALVFVAVGGTAVALTSDPGRQAVSLSVFGLLLALLFVLLQAPDVALSQIAVGTALVPLMVMLAVRKTGKGDR
jgi:energy-converting hydrogenase B subunit D